MPIETQNHPRTAVRDRAPEAAPEADARRAAGPPSPEARAAAALADRRAGDEAAAAPVDAADAVTAEPVPGGWEFAATFGIMVLVLGAVGPGRLSADAVIARTRPAR